MTNNLFAKLQGSHGKQFVPNIAIPIRIRFNREVREAFLAMCAAMELGLRQDIQET